MAQFAYESRDRKGKKTKGNITANSKRDAVLKLKERGLAVLQVQEVKPGLLQTEIVIGNPLKFQDFVIYLRQFSTLLQAGVTVVDATRVLAQQTTSKPLKVALEIMEEDLRSGRPLSQAAEHHKKIFPLMFINMIEAGEAAGNLDETLDRLATYFEKQHKTRQKVKSAMAYPIVVAIIAAAVVTFLLTSVVPTFANMFSGFGAELPAITQMVLKFSEYAQNFWWLFLLIIILIVAVGIILSRIPRVKFYIDYGILRLPLFGKLMQKAVMARMARTLSSLFSSSVPILQALTIVEKVVGNDVLAKVLQDSRNSLEKGRPLTEPMSRHWIFPPLVTQMIAIGEQTGSLDLMLGKVADFYEGEVEMATDQIKSLIEPLMLVFLAVIVGTIVASILIPMFEIFNRIEAK